MKKIILLTVLVLLATTSAAYGQTQVSRIAVAPTIVDHEPSEANNIFKSDVGTISCFTEITTDQAPTGVVHVWSYKDKIMAEVPLQVGAARWRTYSSKKIAPQWQGNWKVEVYSDEGALLNTVEFIVLE
ncbi:MAG: DUF2914 domain-containing protein [Desulfobulbaceae bacterium]|nr:DUF2914 domain-containing protein [Desulfobulbaceae bacterium]HIJ78699.1 DUF2914 domain-containing protein [Deltaproteobacteria bacterium]